MTEAAEALDVTESVTDEQLDKFFASEGNEEIAPETTQAEPAQQEVKAEQAAQEQKQQEKMVPYGAMHEERMRRQELQRELQEQRQRTEKMEQRFQEFVNRSNQPAERAPTFEEDPLEALRFGQTKLAEALNSTHQTLEQQKVAQMRQHQMTQFKSECDRSVAEFEKSAPDYKQAYQFLLENRMKEYEALGYDRDTSQRLLIDDELAIASNAFKAGANPAERIYNLAKMRGYQLKSADVPADKSAQKLDQLERGIKASKSLGSAGGAAAPELTLEALANMDDEEFEKNWDKVMRKYN